MIPRASIDQRVREWGLRHDVVEKDNVLGWLLWGIGRHPVLGESWIFKGGTCLKKCYIETYRFSEDLDFTVIDGGPIDPGDVQPHLAQVLEAVSDESGIDFSDRTPALRARPQPGSVEGRVFYRGPLAAPQVSSIKLDLSSTELLAREPERRPIAHPYQPDEVLPAPADVACYVFEEIFAEKLRAMGERSRPRDLYDIVNLYRREDLRIRRDDIRAILVEKCAHKGVEVPTLPGIEASGRVPELESEWANMLGHQLPVLPPFEQFWGALGELFLWLGGAQIAPALAPLPVSAGDDGIWTPPAVVGVWGTSFPLEEIRFAAVNHLCVDLDYGGETRLIEPYSLRRTREGNLVLHAVRHDSGAHRSYRLDRIQAARATTVPFAPRYAVEFSSAGRVEAPPQARLASKQRVGRAPRSSRTGPTHVIECPVCGRRFNRTTRNRTLNAHKDRYGSRCAGQGRAGRLVDTR